MDTLKRSQVTAFGLVWLSYAASYLLRKPLGIVKMDLSASKFALGMLDVALLLPYSVVQILAGSLIDKAGSRRTLSICLFAAGAAMLPFGYSQDVLFICVLLVVSGAMQGPCWPASCKALSEWYPDGVINSVVGVLSTATYCGAVGGTALAVHMQAQYGLQSVYLPASIMAVLLSIVVFAALKSPADVGVSVPGKNEKTVGPEHPKLTFWELWRIPIVPEISGSVVCLKVVRYAMYMWLPMYFSRQLGYSKVLSGLLSTAFDIGGAIGSPALGFILDRYFQGSTLRGLFFSVAVSAVSMAALITTATWGATYNAVSLFLCGAANGGADSLLAGSVSTAIGEENGRGAGAAVTGLVNGLGTLGAVLEGPLLGLMLSGGMSWDFIIVVLVGVSGFAALLVWRAWRIQRNDEAIGRFHMLHSSGPV